MRGVPARTWDDFVIHFRSRLRVSAQTWNGTYCLEWTGAIGKHGYGNLRYDHEGVRWHKPHRLAWLIAHGSIPDGMSVLHHCDNKPCANEEHLFLGTAKDNHDDMRKKRREANPPRHVGAQHPEAKLTEQQVTSIRHARSQGAHVKALAKQHGVTHQLISRIARGEIWPHAPGPITKNDPEVELDDQCVASIRQLRARGARLTELAARFGISSQQISRIVRGDRWAHAPGPITKSNQGARP